MRTTVDLDADLLERIRREATRRGVPFKELLNATLRRGLAARPASTGKPYVLPTRRMGVVREGISLDKALALADELDNRDASGELGEDE